MNRTARALLLVAAVVIAAGLAFVATVEAPVERDRHAAGNTASDDADAAPSSAAGAALWDAPDPARAAGARADDAVERAYRAGRAHYARMEAKRKRRLLRHFGPDIAAELELPVADAWAALEERLLAGDALAVEALQELGCDELMPDTGTAGVVAQFTQGMAPAPAAFVRGSFEAEGEALAVARSQCRAGGFGPARITELARRKLAADGVAEPPDPPEQPYGIAWDEFDRSIRLARLAWPREDTRRPYDFDPTPRVAEMLADGTVRNDFVTLLALADSDPQAAFLVDACAHGRRPDCADWNALDAAEQRRYIELSAATGSGATYPLNQLLDATGETENAYMWALYQRWLVVSTCGSMSGAVDFINASGRVATLEAALSGAQRAAALARANAMIARQAPVLAAMTGCSG